MQKGRIASARVKEASAGTCGGAPLRRRDGSDWFTLENPLAASTRAAGARRQRDDGGSDGSPCRAAKQREARARENRQQAAPPSRWHIPLEEGAIRG